MTPKNNEHSEPRTGDEILSKPHLSTKHDKINEVIDEERETPDSWIERDKDLIRVTGLHPLNAETPMNLLMADLLTPNKVHYVRNHGSVPKLEWSEHKLTVDGFVNKPTVFSMDDLLKEKGFEVPVTLICDGNRRKEINTIKHSRGFNWGAGAISTAIWKGVKLCDLLKKCEIDEERGHFVCFEGADNLLHGPYGTSLPLYKAMDPSNDVLIAYEQNGERLSPDHGFPCRLIIPGTVGGRAVKWLKRIYVSDEDTDNFYHYHDNKVLPPHVDFDAADSQGWWFHTEYAVYEMNVNSVITTPDHLDNVSSGDDKFTMKGYAYSGGGRRITRVEISLDGGESWDLAKLNFLQYPKKLPGEGYNNNLINSDKTQVKGDEKHGFKHVEERIYQRTQTEQEHKTHLQLRKVQQQSDPSQAQKFSYKGKWWTWTHWSYEIEPWRFIQAHEVIVRAWDESHNTQPPLPTWNVLGMMNNSYYRVKINVEPDKKLPNITFTHPVISGSGIGGWMKEKDVSSTLNHRIPTSLPWGAMARARYGEIFSLEEVKKHNTIDDCWIILDNEVYDVTPYLKEHPGGPEPILLVGGTEASRVFYNIHGKDAHDMKERFLIGALAEECIAVKSSEKYSNVAFKATEWIDCELVDRKDISHDTRQFTFKPVGNYEKCGLPTGQHILFGIDHESRFVARPYTPTKPSTFEKDDGTFELVVKVYYPNESSIFPDGGIVSQFLDKMKVGDKIKTKGPAGHVIYHGDGTFTVHGKSLRVDYVSMVCGGTGITPMFQSLKAMLEDASCHCKVALLYANSTPEDILLKDELDELANKYVERFQLHYTVSKAGDEWKGGRGRINKQMMRDWLFESSEKSIALICGPPAMIERTGMPGLIALGYGSENMFSF
ncbi:nitrate reductase [Acrasis kona]|uniref:Nitrate reductase n=1 Tax=Acrasis kona TaxID=1008807 RepID=A0AAW2YTE8_9EUKA